jgi:phytoene dehydrogenase-like protein
VEVFEAAAELGGGARTAELTLPGFRHDVCSAIHPLARASPLFRELDIDWVEPPAECAHPFDDGSALLLERDLRATTSQFDGDAESYARLVTPIAHAFRQLAADRVPWRALPALPAALGSARSLVERRFGSPRVRGFVAGHAAHSMLPLETRPSAGFALALLGSAHAVGWPFPRGGAQRLADALAARLRELGGTIHTSTAVDELPAAEVVLADVMPSELLRLAPFPARYTAALRRYRHGPGAFKVDWALDGPIPWSASACASAATVHLGASFEEIALSERDNRSLRPFVLLAQPSLFDDTRAPAGKHTAWAYCHVPNGSPDDATDAIEAQVERFAPGFTTRILARSVLGPEKLAAENRNYVGGDINGGRMDLRQLVFRPAVRLVPYRTPRRGVYLCSSATPPGGGVHGLCGVMAAKVAIHDVR